MKLKNQNDASINAPNGCAANGTSKWSRNHAHPLTRNVAGRQTAFTLLLRHERELERLKWKRANGGDFDKQIEIKKKFIARLKTEIQEFEK